jgi:hypothetical protein
MGIPTHQYIEMAARLKRRPTPVAGQVSAPTDAVVREIALHESIMAYCDSQWPKWKYIRARSDRESTIAVGCQDFTIFLPGGRILLMECKSKTGKLSPAQRNWAHEMNALGHTVHEVRSFDEFLTLIERPQL